MPPHERLALSTSRWLALSVSGLLCLAAACSSSDSPSAPDDGADDDPDMELSCLDSDATPEVTAFTVAPEVLNPQEVSRELERAYPAILRDAGIGGTVDIWFHLDATGQTLDICLAESSGHTELDQAALEVAPIFEFSPALNEGEPVEVWIQLPIVFEVR